MLHLTRGAISNGEERGRGERRKEREEVRGGEGKVGYRMERIEEERDGEKRGHDREWRKGDYMGRREGRERR